MNRRGSVGELFQGVLRMNRGFICVPASWRVVSALVIGLFSLFAVGSEAAPTKDGGIDYGISQVQAINQHIRKGWQENDLVGSSQATDPEWCRRVFLDVLG